MSRTPQELASSGRSITTLFTHDDWEYHQTTSRYFRNLFNIGGSAVFRRCLAVRCLQLGMTHLCWQHRPACSTVGSGQGCKERGTCNLNTSTCSHAIPLACMCALTGHLPPAHSAARGARAAEPTDDAVCGGGGGVQPADMRLRYSPAVKGALITT